MLVSVTKEQKKLEWKLEKKQKNDVAFVTIFINKIILG